MQMLTVCREKMLEDRVRRRVWKRERMLLSVTGLPMVLNRQLQEESRMAAMVSSGGNLPCSVVLVSLARL